MLVGVEEALAIAGQWSSIESLGGASVPMLAVDLRGIDRSVLVGSRDRDLATALIDAPWVNLAVVDDDLDPVFVDLADSFDVLIGDGTTSTAAVDSDDVAAAVAEVRDAVEASPAASVALVRLLRLSHALPIAQALHAESLTYAMLQTSDRFVAWLRDRGVTKPVSDPDEQAVAVQLTGSLLRVTLQRPKKRNALNIAMRDQLVAALELLDLDDSIDGALLSGAGANFSAGGDLDEFGTTPSPATGHSVRKQRSLPLLMHRVADRVRVHLHGTCVGAGIEVPAFASSVIAHPDATFRLPEIGFGLVPGAGGTVSVTRRCGRHRTAWLALTGHAISADHALHWHLIDRIDERVPGTLA